MRTTVRIDPDLAANLRRVARERGISFKEALNTMLRAGMAARAGAARPYRLRARHLGLRPEIDLDKALHLAAALEDEESVHKLELRK
ncbi:MAG: antitoxin [Thermoleophilaceae bacterium]